RVLDIFDARLAEAQFGLLEKTLQSLVLACQPLGIDQEAEAFIERQALQAGTRLLLDPGGGQGVKLQFLELATGRFIEHGSSVSCSTWSRGRCRERRGFRRATALPPALAGADGPARP